MSQQSITANYRHVKTVNPSTFLSNAFFTSTSESITHFMVEKIISLVMTHLLEKEVINSIPGFCFDDVKKTIDPYIQICFIPYDHDDLGIPLLKEVAIEDIVKEGNKKPEIFDSNIEQIDKVEDNHSHNTYNSHQSIIKPIDLEDEGEGYEQAVVPQQAHINATLNFHGVFYDNCIEGTNFWDIPSQPKTVVIDRDASTIIPYEKMPPNQESKESDESVLSQKKERKDYNYGPKKKKDKNLGPQMKKKGQPPLEIVAYDLPKELIFNVNETEELVQMRIDREKEIIQREIENRKIKKKAEENLEKLNEVVKKQKEFEYKNITVDSNGAIIFIKEVQPEFFPVEFKGPSSTTKEIQLIKAEPLKLPIVPQGNQKHKSVFMNLSPEKERDKDRESTKEKQSRKSQGQMAKVISVVNRMNMLSPEKKSDLKEEKIFREKFSIQPSGSAFDAIKLEVGVALLEETKYKTGGKDFYKKYKKYSVETFQTTQAKTTNNYDVSFHKEKKIENSKKEQDDKGKAKDNEVNYVNINTEPGSTVKVMNVKTKNFRNVFDKLDLIIEEQEKVSMKKKFNRTRPGDMYKKVKPIQLEEMNNANMNTHTNRMNNTQTSFNEMNQFAKTILSNQAWGSSPLKFKETLQNPKIPIKPLLNDIMKELPGGMINTKMPRARRFAHANKDHNQAMNNTTTTGFFKVVKNSKYKAELTQTGTFKPKDDLFCSNSITNPNTKIPFNKTVTDNLYKE